MTHAPASGAVAMVPGTRLQDLMPADSAPAPFDIAAVFEPATLAALQAAALQKPVTHGQAPEADAGAVAVQGESGTGAGLATPESPPENRSDGD